jgi:4-hydroxybenzoate polyprenyltransferase
MECIKRLIVWLRALRLSQWTKNLLIPAAWLFALGDPGQRAMASGWRPVLLMLGMFGSFCLISSAFYLLNDVRDISSDRLHPVKRFRPIAASLISIRAARAMSAFLLVLGFIPSLVMFLRHIDRWPMLAVVIAYSAMQLCYTGFLKRLPYVDVIVIASGFVLRAIAGTTVLGVRLSPWLLLCAFSLSLFLALCKRRHEKLLCEESRPALKMYHLPTIDMLIASSAMVTLSVYVAYTLVPSTIARYECGGALSLTAIPVALGLVRYLWLTYSLADVGRPDKLLLSDKIMWLVLVCYAIIAALVVLPNGIGIVGGIL